MTDSFSENKNSICVNMNDFHQAIEKILGEAPGTGMFTEEVVLPSGLRVTHRCSLAVGFSSSNQLKMYRSQFGKPPVWLGFCHPYHVSSLCRLALEKRIRLPDMIPQFIPFSLARRLGKKQGVKVLAEGVNMREVEPIESFYPLLIKDNKILAAIREEFGKKSSVVIEKLMIGITLANDELYVTDIIKDIIHNEFDVADEFQGLGDYGEFSICIFNYGPICWVSVPEFDDIGYFRSVEKAREYAESEYYEFINAYDEQEQEDSDI